MKTLKTIAVVGATGRQGGAVLRHLLRTGECRVRSLVRDKTSAAAARLPSLGAEVHQADLEDPAALEKALVGAVGVFSVQNYWEKGVGYDGEIRQGKNLALAAKRAGVGHFVQSTMADGAIAYTDEMKHFRSKKVLEDYIDDIGLPRTFLGTVTFVDNILVPELGGAWTFPFISGILSSQTPYHVLAVDDIGGVAAAVFAEPDRFIGRKINMAGDALTVPEMKSTFTGRYRESAPNDCSFPSGSVV